MQFHSEDDFLACIARHFPESCAGAEGRGAGGGSYAGDACGGSGAGDARCAGDGLGAGNGRGAGGDDAGNGNLQTAALRKHVILGRGDDCAELLCPPELCMSTDVFLQDAHFRTRYFRAADIGYKALAVNISDIAAAGGVPLGFSLGLMVPTGAAYSAAYGGDFWDELFASMAGLAHAHGLVLTGGDISAAPCLGFSLTIWGAKTPRCAGEPAESVAAGASLFDPAAARVPFLRRRGAENGDALFMIGDAGLARTGLLALEAEQGAGETARAQYPHAVAAHFHPVPRVAEGQILARLAAQLHEGAGEACAGQTARITLMDISDGLARDVPRLLNLGNVQNGERLGAELNLPESALHEEVRRYAALHGIGAAEHAYKGGEEFGLLGSCAPFAVPHLLKALPQARILGRVNGVGTVTLNGKPVQARGFDHFA